MVSMLEAVGLAVLFTFMILASLYESPIIPLTIMLAIPLAIVGAFFALFIGQKFVPTLSLNIFSMIALIMLLGLVTKNSILLVDYTLHMMQKGMSRDEALKEAGEGALAPHFNDYLCADCRIAAGRPRPHRGGQVPPIHGGGH